MRLLFAVVLLLFAATALVQAQPGRDLSTGQRVLAGTEWLLVSLGPPGSESNVVAGTTPTAKFGEDGRVGGSTGCNGYGGTYEVRGDTITIGRLVSTRRACLDQNANEQERRFLAALEAANRFRLSSDRLSIISDRGRSVLNFVSSSPSDPGDRPPTDGRSDPLTTLASYFSAINAKDYRRAYRFWESPPSSFERFAGGFADIDRVRLLVDPTVSTEGAAGSVYAEIPTLIVYFTRGSNERVYAGCYLMRRSNVRDRGWQIYRADVSQFPITVRLPRLLPQSCRR
jgi:heat shock protein HslJ